MFKRTCTRIDCILVHDLLNIGLSRQLKALYHLLLTNTSPEKQLFYYLYERWQKKLTLRSSYTICTYHTERNG